jgi:hypothetical protein
MKPILANAYDRIAQINVDLEAENKRHTEAVEKFRKEIEAEKLLINQFSAGLDPEKIAKGCAVVSIRGDYESAGGEAYTVVRDAINQIATGVSKQYSNLWLDTLGVKDYSQWTGQRSDHSRGCGPKHGHITFSVEFTDAVVRREEKVLTDEERECAIYVLHNLVAIQKARKEAKKAA